MQNKQSLTQDKEAQPLVTFIVTYYGLPVSLLCECIDSILALSLRPFEREIIVVDDGSPESPMQELMRYGNDIIYTRKANGGVSTARNFGLRTATGQYVQFVDGDDTLIQPTYEHCLDIARYGKADVIMYDFTRQPGTDTAYSDSEPVSGSEYLRTRNINGASCLYLFQRNILGSLNFTPGTDYGEDEEFTPQLLLRAENVMYTSAKAYYYRQRDSSATACATPEKRRQRLDENLQVILRLNETADTLPAGERVALQRRIAQLTMDNIYNTIVLTRDRQHLDRLLEQLRDKGLFPLPDRDYTRKYKWFRRLTNSSLGRAILISTLPHIKRER